jgi:chromosomal replication initiation ATPase DnaA
MPDCDLCQNRGWQVVADGGNGLARPCACRTRRPLADRLAAAGVWEQYLHCTRDTWRGAWPAAELADFGIARHLCTIVGRVGSGKTHLATAILGEWLQRGGRGLWRETSAALEEIKRAVSTGGGSGGSGGTAGADRLIDDLKSARHLLVLDDLFTQQATDWADFTASHVLRYRLGRQRPTIVTANVTDLLELDRIEPRLGSRCGAGIVIALAGDDRRTAPEPAA